MSGGARAASRPARLMMPVRTGRRVGWVGALPPKLVAKPCRQAV